MPHAPKTRTGSGRTIPSLAQDGPPSLGCHAVRLRRYAHSSRLFESQP